MTPDFLNLAILVATALFASFFAAITGGGVTVMVLPVLVFQFGIQAAMPIVTIALFAASASRVAAYGRQIDFRPVWWFSLGSLPFTLLGTYLFTVAEPDLLTRTGFRGRDSQWPGYKSFRGAITSAKVSRRCSTSSSPAGRTGKTIRSAPAAAAFCISSALALSPKMVTGICPRPAAAAISLSSWMRGSSPALALSPIGIHSSP